MPKTIDEATLFDVVLDAIAEHGYRGITTRRIAELAGINEVTLFRRYGDKRSLLLAAIHGELERIDPSGLVATDDVQADLHSVVEHYARVFHERGSLVLQLIVESRRDPEVAAVISEPLMVIAQVGRILAHHQKSGALRDEPTDQAVLALMGPLLMAAVLGGTVTLDPDDVVNGFLTGHAGTPCR